MFGTEYTLQNKENQLKCRDAKFKKYDGEPMHNQSIVDKVMETWNNKSDEELEEIQNKTNLTKKKNRYEEFFGGNTSPLFSLSEFHLNDYNKEYNWHCKICGNDFSGRIGRYVWDGEGGYSNSRCPFCHPICQQGTSDSEKEIVNFISNFTKDILENDRHIICPKELDIFIPSRKIAIEYDGLFWHSFTYHPDSKYHLEKTTSCERQGIHLIHIFENEWLNKQDIVKSRIKNLLGVHDKVVYARKCSVRFVESKESFGFQETNHLQGGVYGSVNIGLYCDDELVSLMTFSKPRFSKKYEWELVRFCNKLGYHVPGGASRLLKHFERNYNPKSLVSYADRRWTMNSGSTTYDKLGFKLDSISKPNYWYFKNKDHEMKLESRIKYQKHKLKSVVEHFDPSKSEWDNMVANNYNKIFDCGNLVYAKEYN